MYRNQLKSLTKNSLIYTFRYNYKGKVDVSKDWYKVLGVQKNVSKSDLKKKYFQLAKKYHPDHYDKEDNTFKEISQAYEILSDEDSRRVFDHQFNRNQNHQQYQQNQSQQNQHTKYRQKSQEEVDRFYREQQEHAERMYRAEQIDLDIAYKLMTRKIIIFGITFSVLLYFMVYLPMKIGEKRYRVYDVQKSRYYDLNEQQYQQYQKKQQQKLTNDPKRKNIDFYDKRDEKA